MTSSTAPLALQLLCQLCTIHSDANGTYPTIDINQLLPPVKDTVLPDGYIPYPDIGMAYKVHDEIVSWPVARKECVFEGGNLAVIDSYTKLRYATSQRTTNGWTHVGIIRMYDDEEWTSVKSDSCVSSIPWAQGEPSGSYDCVGMKSNVEGLANYRCDGRANFLCEIPLNQNHHSLAADLISAAAA